MSENDQLRKMDATEKKEVQTAEFVTESFSAFTITWVYKGIFDDYTKGLQVNYYELKDGNYIPINIAQEDLPKQITWNNHENVDLSQYVIDIDEYTHRKTLIGFSVISQDNIEVSYVRAESDTWLGGVYWNIKYLPAERSNTDKNYEIWDESSTPQIFIIYEKTGGTIEPDPGPDEPDPSVEPLGEPEHNKTIERTGEDSYTLSLDVTGKQGDATPIDVLLIVDKSNSMNRTRRNNVNNAISILKNRLQSSEIEADIQMAAVTFSGPNSGAWSDSDSQSSNNGDAWIYGSGWMSLDDFDFSLSDVSGGTNWQAGVRKGENLLARTTRANSKKYVIFLTDGDPTFRYGSTSATTVGTGDSDRYNNNYKAAVNEWNNSPNLSAPTTIKYVVDATGTSSNKCDDFAEDIAATELAGGNWNDLQSSFGEIADNITKPSYTNVSINDSLSQYAEFASNPNLRVYEVNNGQETELDEDEYTYSINENRKTVRVNLLNGKELEDGVTYRIKFDIVPSEKAYQEYAENKESNPDGTGYGNVVGDENTDTNLQAITSSNKPGFHSNERAYVSYRENRGSQLEAEYKHPVLQVEGEYEPEIPTPQDPELSAPAHQKYIRDNGNGKYDLFLDVTGKLGDADPIDILLIVDKSNSMNDPGGDGSTRKENVNAAVNTLIETLKDANVETEINLRVVTFNKIATAEKNGWTNLKDITISKMYGQKYNNFFTLGNCSGGTNWEAGIKEGEKQFANRSDSKKYVIFLTDGVPTYAYEKNQNNEWLVGNGYADQDINYLYTLTKLGWDKTTILKDSSTTKYVVDVSGGAANGYCNNFAKYIIDQDASAIQGNSSSELSTAFSQIATGIVRPAYNTVVITDTLSQYVDFDKVESETENSFAEKVKVYEYEKNEQIDADGNKTFNEPQESNLLDKSKYTCEVDFDTKTVTVNLTGVGEKGDSKLQDGMTYVVKFPVVTTEEAEYEYLLNGYGEVMGDVNTDAPDNESSSQKPGFHSNTLATVSYKVDTSETQTETYDYPVVQVSPEIVSKTVKKIWEGEPAEGTTIEVQLKAEVDRNGDGVIDMTLNHDNYASLPEDMTITLDSNSSNEDSMWAYTWDNLPRFYYYTDRNGEIQKVEEPIIYSIDETDVPEGYDKTDVYENGDITTIINTKQAFIEASKQWDNGSLVLDEGESLSHGTIKVALYYKDIVEDGTVVELSEANGYWCKYSIPYNTADEYTVKEVVENSSGDIIPVEGNTSNSQYLMVTDTLTTNTGDIEIQNIYTPTYETVTNADNNPEVKITNTLQLGSIEITKTNTDIDPTPDDSLLPGAVFKITNKAGEEVATLTTGDGTKKGVATLSNLLPGEYTITEIQSPAGYSLLANPVTVIVGTTEGNSKTDNYYEVVNDDDKHYYDLKLKIINNKLFTMPEAGGRNIFLMTLAGTAMIALAGGSTIYYRRRRGVHNRRGR